MTIIKTIKEGFIIVGLLIISIYFSNLISKSKLILTFSDFNFQNIKLAVISLNFALLGTYWYLFKNLWISFKSKIVIGIFIMFCLIQLLSCAYLLKWGLDLKPMIESTYNEIAFPTEPDFVKKNIKFFMITNAGYMLIAFLAMALIGLFTGVYKWIKYPK